MTFMNDERRSIGKGSRHRCRQGP